MTLENDSAINVQRDETQIEPQAVQDSASSGPLSVRTDNCSIGNDKVKMEVIKKFRCLLNKLTLEKYELILGHIMALPMDTDEILESLADILFNKAVAEPHFAFMYARLFSRMNRMLSENPSTTFGKFLLKKCQDEFFKIAINLEVTNEASISREESVKREQEENSGRKLTGLCRFIVELFKEKIIAPKILHSCINHLLDVGTDEALLGLCEFFVTAGQQLEEEFAQEMQDWFRALQVAVKSTTSSKCRLILLNLLDLRQRNWITLEMQHKFEMRPETLNIVKLKATPRVVRQLWLTRAADSSSNSPIIREPMNSDHDMPESELLRSMKGILNRLSFQNVDRLAEKFKGLPLNTFHRLNLAARMIISTAVYNPMQCQLFVELCANLQNLAVLVKTNDPYDEKIANSLDSPTIVTFKDLLFDLTSDGNSGNCLQRARLKPWITITEMMNCSEDAKQINNFISHKTNTLKVLSIGLSRFIGELYKRGILSPVSTRNHIDRLLIPEASENHLQCAYTILLTAGQDLEDHTPKMDDYFKKIREFIENKKNISFGTKHLLKELVELRGRDWEHLREIDLPQVFVLMQKATEVENILNSIELHSKRAIIDKAWNECPQKSSLGLNSDSELRRPNRSNKQRSSECSLDESKITKTLNRLLNNLTPQNFERYASQIRELPFESEEDLMEIVYNIFERAVDDSLYLPLYADLCHCLQKLMIVGVTEGAVSFRKILLNKCQDEFENIASYEQNTESGIDGIPDSENDNGDNEDKRMTKEEFKRKSVGLMRLIGELYNRAMLTPGIIRKCTAALLSQAGEVSIECACKLLTSAGKQLERELSKEEFEEIMTRIYELTTNTHDPPVSLRIKFMLQELLELRRNGWISQYMGNQYSVEPMLHQAEPSQYSNWRHTSENKFQSDILYSNNSELQHPESSSEEGAHSEVAPPSEVAVPTSVPNEETPGQLKLSPTWRSIKPNKMGTSESRMEPIVSENILEEESSTGDVNYTKQQGYADVSRINKGVISDHDDPATPLECKTCGGSEKDSTSTDTVKENESDGIVESTNLSLQDTSDSLKNCKTIVETNEMKGVMVDGLENSLDSPSPISSATGDSPIPCSPSKIEQVEESMMRAMIVKYFTEPLSSSDNSLPAYYVSEEKYGKLWLECPEASDMDSCEHKRSCSKFSQLRASNFIQLGESLIGYPASSWFEENTLGSPVHSEKSIDPENNETKPMRVQIWITEKSHPTAYDVKNDIFLKMCVVEEINRSDLVPPHRAYLTTDGNIEFSLNVGNQKQGIADFIDEFQRTQNFGLDRKQYSPSWESVIDALNRIPLYVTSEQAMSHSKSKTRSRGKRGRKHKKSASKEGSNNEKTDFNDESIVTNLQSEFTLENDSLGVPVSTGVGIDCLNHGGSIVELVRSVDFYKAFSELSNNDEPSKMNDLGNDGVGSTKTVVSVDASFAVVGSGVNDELVDSSNLIQDESNNGMDEMSDIGLDGACHALDQIHLTESPEELMMRNGIQDFIDEQNTETMNHTTDEGEKLLQNRASSTSPIGFTETCVDQEPMSEVDWMGVTIGIEKILADETGGSETDDSEKGSNIELSDKKRDSDELVNHIKEDLLDDESEDVKHSDNHSSESDDETSGSSTETESQDSESLTTDVTSPTDKESTSNMGISSKANEDVMRFEKIELSSSLNSLRDIGLKVVHPRGINIVSHLYKIPDAHWLAGTGIEPVSTPIKLIKSSSKNVSSSLLKALERTCFKVDNATSSTPGKVASTSSYEPKPNTINTIKSPSQNEPSTTLKVLEKTCSKVGNATNSTSEKVASTSSCEPKSTTIMIKSSSQDVSSTLLKALEKTSLAKNSTSGQDSVQTISSYVPPWKRAQFSSKDIKQTGDKSEDSAIRKTKLEMIAEKLTPTETGEAHSKSEKRREDINSSDKVENEGSPFMLKSLPSHFGQPPSNNMSQGFARHALSDPSTSRSDLLRTIESQPAVDSITQEPRMVSSMLGATSSRAPVPQRFTSSVVPAPPMGAIPVRTPLQMKPALLQGVKMAKVCHYSNRPDEFGQLVGDCITTMSAEQRTHAINIIWDVLTEGNYHTLCEYSRLSGVMNGQESGKEGPSQPTNNPQPFINYGFPPSLPATKFPFPRSNDPTAYSFQGEKNPVTISSDLTHKIQNPQPATHKTQESGPKQSLVGHNVASNQKSFPSVGNKCPPLLNQETLSKKAGLGVKTSQPKIKSKQKSPINPNPSSSKQGTNTTKKTLAKNVVKKPQGAVKLSVKSQNESHPNPNEPTNWRNPARPFLSYVMNRSESTLIPKTENLATGSQNPVSTFEKVIPKTKANKDKSAKAGQPIPASEGSSKKKKKKIRVRNSAKTKPTSNS